VWSRPLPPDVIVALDAVATMIEQAVTPRRCVLVVHGSLALGGFEPVVSDVDVLVIVDDRPPLGPTGWRKLGGDLATAAVPGRGIELSVVDLVAAARPAPPWPFLLHVATEPAGAGVSPKVVLGEGHGGDPDLLMHYAVAREAGVTRPARPVDELVGEVERPAVLRYLVDELAWAVTNAGESYAVLNAGRALRYLLDGSIVSKLDGATTALAEGAPAAIVERALDVRRGRVADRDPTEPALAFVAATRRRLAAAAAAR